MKYLIVLTALFACALSAEHKPRWVLPRLPLSVILSGRAVLYDENDPKIVGGAVVTPNSLPFQISLQRKDSSGSFSQSCGGSILDANVILNAAHCVRGVTDLTTFRVVAGEHDLNRVSGLEQNRDVSRFVMNDYAILTKENDIALIFLSSPLDTSVPEVKPVNLPSRQNEDLAAGTMVTVSGWGTTTAGGTISNQLKSVDVPIVSDAECDRLYGAGSIKPSMLCAGDTTNGGEDSCQGDSGGPLFIGTGASAVQHGIVSWGSGCADARYPGVYTQVSYFLDWIAANRG